MFAASDGRPSAVHKLILTERSPLMIPAGAIVLHSEVVVNEDDEEVLELWISAPTAPTPDTSATTAKGPQTIYTNTVVHEDEDDFRAEIENAVSESMEEYPSNYEEDDDWY